jgi:hypothetical protein
VANEALNKHFAGTESLAAANLLAYQEQEEGWELSFLRTVANQLQHMTVRRGPDGTLTAEEPEEWPAHPDGHNLQTW